MNLSQECCLLEQLYSGKLLVKKVNKYSCWKCQGIGHYKSRFGLINLYIYTNIDL